MPPKKKPSDSESSNKSELHKVLIHNDDKTTMEFVVFLLMSVFDKAQADATRIMLEVHNAGVGVAGEYTREIAEAKVIAADTLAKAKGQPLLCSIEGDELPKSKSEEKRHAVLPKGWLMSGSDPDDYIAGVDSETSHTGTRCAFVENATAATKGFGTLMQQFSPNEFLEKRLQMTMWVKTKNVKGRIQPWLRIDGPRERIDSSSGKLLGFDNACNRPMMGTKDWKKYELVLDVPKESRNIAFGIIIAGTGKAWIDDISFEAVGNDVDTTECSCFTPHRGKQGGPRNLNFEE